MNAISDLVERLAASPPGVVLLCRLTLWLACAWILHAALAGRNPRWRVGLWRLSAVGLVLVVALAALPPIVTWRVAPASVAPAPAPAPAAPVRVFARTDVPPRPQPAPSSAPKRSHAATGPNFSTPAVKSAPAARPAMPSAPERAVAETIPANPGPNIDRGQVLVAVWIVGVLLLAARLAVAARRVARVVGRAGPVPDWLVEESRVIAARLGVARAVRVARSAEVSTPCLTGLLRPVLLLPDGLYPDDERADVRAILAHELAHARGRDLVWNDAWYAASVLLWFHPLVWKARGAHVAACDSVCDAVAVDLLGDVSLYVRTLARLALEAARPLPVRGLAMARASEVGRRIESLRRRVFRSTLPQGLAMPAMLTFGSVALLLGGLGFAEDSQVPTPTPPPAAAVAKNQMVVRVVTAKTGDALEGVTIRYRGRFGGVARNETVTTASDGTAIIEWPQGAMVSSLTLDAKKSRYVSIRTKWPGDERLIALPERHEIRLEPGTTVGGTVKDDAGKPVAGAAVSFSISAVEPATSPSRVILPETKTDDHGRWQIHEAPENIATIVLYVEHPQYRKRYGAQIEGRDSLVVLKRGMTVRGRVVDAAERPVKGAHVVIHGDDWRSNQPQGTTDERGQYVVVNCDPGPWHVTVQAKGFAPEMRDVQVASVGETTAPELRLEPGSSLRIKVIDNARKPVPGAYVAADSWRGRQSISFRDRTDADGFVSWSDAPRDAVEFDIFLDGYMRRRLVPLVASAAEHIITLNPELVVSGRVTDAATGRPVPRFQVIQGRHQFTGPQETLWSTDRPEEATGGSYSTRFDFPMRAHFVRVEAPGFKAAESRAFQSDEGRQTQDFALEREAGVSGVVLGPDGKPAAGVAVAVANSEHHVTLRGGVLERDSPAPKMITGADGRFDFPAQGNHFTVVAAGYAGYADASREALAKTGKLVLEPWGRLEGDVRIGRAPGANQPVTFQPMRPERRGIFVFGFGYSTGTDGQGRFTFERVVPGPGIVSRNVVTDFANGSQQVMPCWIEPVTVRPGATSRVVVGGKGRPVVGRLVIDGPTDEPIDWTRNEPARLAPPRTGGNQDGTDMRQFASNIDTDGRFRIVDVTSGRYTLTIPVNGQPDPKRCGSGGEIGKASLEVEVPAGSPEEPFNLGDVTAKLLPTLKERDLAPDFTVTRLDGGRLSLAALQGKLVLLDFWATWCAPCLAEMPAMKELQVAFGSNPRFMLVGLSCDEQPEAPRDYARKNGLTWTQGLAGGLGGGTAERYLIRSIPATFLVGPDGRILARNLRGPALKEAVRKALADEKLFADAKPAVRPPRFPVTRLEVERPGAAASAPAVVVMDDSDDDYAAARPHHDGLRFLDESGREVQALREFNTCQSVSAAHCVAIDAARGRVYVCELVADRVTALDTEGRKLWRVDDISADALAVDPRTGNLWCAVGTDLARGETVVLDPEGKEAAAFPVRGIDVAYDPHTDGFWLVGYGITKLSRTGETLFHKPHEGWACVSVAVDPTDGSVWIGERDHPDISRSANRLWHLDARGAELHSMQLGKQDPFAVACDPRTGVAWVVNYRSEMLRFARDGRRLAPIPVRAEAIAISPSREQVWVTAKTEILRLDEDGKIVVRVPRGSDSGQSRLAAY